MLADILKQNNVNNQGLLFDPHARTALAFVTLRSDGEREFMFYRNPSADMLLEEKELDLDLIQKVWKCILLPFQYLCVSTTIDFLSSNSWKK
jgi:sugar/nucleoside kinase (ribokinase family)